MKKILLIDDEASLRDNIVEVLTLEGYDVIPSADGRDGFEKAVNLLPDIILCDVMMPVMDGIEMFSKIKENELTKNIPFVFLTALVDRFDIKKGQELGADDYLAKPFTIESLLKTINTHLGKSG